MKVALVHDYLNQFGGAERVLQALTEIYPKAPIYTLFYDEAGTRGLFSDKDIRTSKLQRRKFIRNKHHFFPMLMPHHIEQFDLSGFDVVLSDSASFAKGVITAPHTLHVNYCHTPLRYGWDGSHQYLNEYGLPKFAHSLAPIGLNYLRLWDYAASRRVDHFIANSEFVGHRITKYYRRPSTVIHPPVDIPKAGDIHGERENFYLVVARLEPYKRTDLAVKAFNSLGAPLKIIGKGRELDSLKSIANNNIEFIGSLSDSMLSTMYLNARALIFPQVEDFGITPVEAMAHGTPVIAFGSGGALETIKAPETGVFFRRQTPGSLVDAIKRFEKMQFDRELIYQQARTFDKEIFKDTIKSYIETKLDSKDIWNSKPIGAY